MVYGITVKRDDGGSRDEVQCMHQDVIVDEVPAEASWVCSDELVHAHSIAGFLADLSGLSSPEVTALMRKWGIYCRERPLESLEAYLTSVTLR